MSRNSAVKKYPATPPEVGPRAPHAAEIVALVAGGPPYAAPIEDRQRIASLVQYWAERLDAEYTTRRIDSEIVVWRTA